MPILNTLIDLLLAPFRRLPAEAGVAAFSVLLAVVVLVIFKYTSDPCRVARARNRAVARILEMWLYRDDPWVCLGAFGRLLWDNSRYLGRLAMPALASLVPALLLFAQAHDWFAARPLRPGEATLLVAQVKANTPPDTLKGLGLSVGLQGATAGYCSGSGAGALCVRIDSPPVRAPAAGEVAWRLRATDKAGVAVLAIADASGAVRVEKRVCAGSRLVRVSQRRTRAFGEWLLYPGEPRLPANQPFVRLTVLYPAAEYNFLGLRLGWFWAVLVLSLLAGLALKRPLKVEF